MRDKAIKTFLREVPRMLKMIPLAAAITIKANKKYARNILS
jgi:hypothetical protein